MKNQMILNTNINKKNKTYDNGRYEEQIFDNKREVKGICYYNSHERYEVDLKND